MEEAIKEVIMITWPTLVIVLLIVIILRLALLFTGERKSFCFHEEIFVLFFLAYLLILFQLVTSQDIMGGEANFIPFNEILRYKFGSTEFYKQVIGNILLFVQLGYFATKFCKIKGFGGITLVVFLSSLTIESVQYFIGRTFDVDDIILNVVGGIIGFLLYIGLNAIKIRLPKILQKDFVYNILCIILIVLLALYFIKIF